MLLFTGADCTVTESTYQDDEDTDSNDCYCKSSLLILECEAKVQSVGYEVVHGLYVTTPAKQILSLKRVHMKN